MTNSSPDAATAEGNEPVANPETSGEDTSDSEDKTPANGPAAPEHPTFYECTERLKRERWPLTDSARWI